MNLDPRFSILALWDEPSLPRSPMPVVTSETEWSLNLRSKVQISTLIGEPMVVMCRSRDPPAYALKVN